MSNSTLSPAPIDSPQDHGGVVNVVAWFLAFANIAAVFSRLGTKWVIQHKVGWDDGFITASLLLSLCQMAMSTLQVKNGLGQHFETLESGEQVLFQKALYAGNILLVLSLCFAKLSLIFLIQMITPVRLHRKICLGIAAVTAAWGITSGLVAAFSCDLPQPWNFVTGSCIDRTSFWIYFYTMNVLTDAALIILPTIILLSLQVSLMQRINTIMIFAFRTLAVAATIAEIVLLHRASNTKDPTFDYWLPALIAGVVQSLSIMASCLPYLKPFLESLQSGMIRSDDLGRTTGGNYGSGGSQSAIKRPSGRGWRKVTPSPSKGSAQHELSSISGVADKDGNITSIIAHSFGTNDQRDLDLHSQSSQTRIIKRTVAWTVSNEEEEQGKEGLENGVTTTIS